MIGCINLGGALRWTAGLWLVFVVPVALVNAAPKIQHWSTNNGARVYFIAAPELPIVDVRVVFDAGSARDAGKSGVAQLTGALLAAGAGDMNADQVAERFAELGVEFGTDVERDMAVVSMRSLSQPPLLQAARQTLALVLARPAFPDTGFRRERSRMLVGLRQEEQSPGAIAEKAFYAALYRDHPYASPPSGTTESLIALQRQDVIDHYKRYYVGANAVVAIVGALDQAQARSLAEAVVGGLPRGAPAPALERVRALEAARSIHIEHPSAQTHVLMGQPGVFRGDPDYFALYLGNHILGGSGLVSRLSDEVREQRGLSYSVYSYFVPMRRAGPFTLGLQTRNEQTGEALRVARDTLRKFVEQGPTEEELHAAKKNITGGFALRVSSNKKQVGYIAMIGFYGLPLDYLEKFNRHIEAVTLEQIRDAFKRRTDPDRLLTVTVGGAP